MDYLVKIKTEDTLTTVRVQNVPDEKLLADFLSEKLNSSSTLVLPAQPGSVILNLRFAREIKIQPFGTGSSSGKYSVEWETLKPGVITAN